MHGDILTCLSCDVRDRAHLLRGELRVLTGVPPGAEIASAAHDFEEIGALPELVAGDMQHGGHAGDDAGEPDEVAAGGAFRGCQGVSVAEVAVAAAGGEGVAGEEEAGAGDEPFGDGAAEGGGRAAAVADGGEAAGENGFANVGDAEGGGGGVWAEILAEVGFAAGGARVDVAVH